MKNLITLFLVFAWGSASAVPVKWTLNSVTFADDPFAGSLADVVNSPAYLTGSFVYDADTNIYSDISLVAEAGTGLWGTSAYADSSIIVSADNGALTLDTGGPGTVFCGLGFCYKVLALDYESALTNAGGFVAINTTSGSAYEQFSTGGGVFERSIVSGSLFGTVVPIPAAVWLFGSALAFLGWTRRKRAN